MMSAWFYCCFNLPPTHITLILQDYMPKKLTSMSFKKYKKGATWGILETDLFYGLLIFATFLLNIHIFLPLSRLPEVLAATGTDFGLMHEFISSRSRLELKQ